MCVCEQVLWPELSGYEHLCLYGRIKGLGWKNVRASADDLLERVRHTHTHARAPDTEGEPYTTPEPM